MCPSTTSRRGGVRSQPPRLGDPSRRHGSLPKDQSTEAQEKARQQAAQHAGPSATQVVTRAKGKERVLTEAKVEEQCKRLKEEKLRYQLMHRQLQDKAKNAQANAQSVPRETRSNGPATANSPSS